MKYYKRIISTLFILALIYTSGCNSSAYLRESGGKAKNVILIIGDGMGLSHLYGAMTVYRGEMNIEKARNVGFVKTHSFDNYNTDSAASGTAMSTGKKTRNGMLGLTPDSLTVSNLIEIAHRNDVVAGVVSTSAVTHATPASFVSHNISRTNYEEIALDFLKTQPDVFIGGGRRYFSKRSDGKDLIKELRAEGYDVVLSLEELLEIEGSKKLAGLLAEEHMPKISDGRDNMLSYATIKAIEALQDNPKGFFLMIEASQIDWAAHNHDTKYIVEETIDLDRTLGVVLDYAERAGGTLVLVTADHETGGMTLVQGDTKTGSLTADFSVPGHTGTPVPIFAFGPSSMEFTGFMDNTDLFKKIRKILTNN
jgi:alkaline phosphatase